MSDDNWLERMEQEQEREWKEQPIYAFPLAVFLILAFIVFAVVIAKLCGQ